MTCHYRLAPILALVLLPLAACDKTATVSPDAGADGGSLAVCGNGTIEVGEQCDDGPLNSDQLPDACRSNCQRARCGDGTVDTGEQCDRGAQNSDLVPDACRLDCLPARCGDGVVDVQRGENCDDGNTVEGDGCNNRCVVEYCGNGSLDAGEVCDDGNFEFGDGCSANCQSDETCGNGIVDYAAGEQCDDGNDLRHDGCASGACLAEIPQWSENRGPSWTARWQAAVAYDRRNLRSVVFGGDGQGGPFDDTWTFDGTDLQRRQPLTSPPARRGHAMTYDWRRDRVVLFGGLDPSGPLGDTWEWDGQDWRPIVTATAPAARGHHAMTYDVHRRRVVLFGGQTFDGTGHFGDTWEYDGIDWVLRNTAAAPNPRGLHAMAYDPTRRVTVLFGGETPASAVTGQTWEYDGTNWSLRSITGPAWRREHGMAFTPLRGTVVMFGGFGLLGGARSDTWEWAGSGWQQVTTNNTPPARGGHAMIYDPYFQRIVLFGGTTGNAEAGAAAADQNVVGWGFDLWTGAWDWRALEGGAPSWRWDHAMAYDTDRERVVLFGGVLDWLFIVPTVSSETWEWDGRSWWKIGAGTPPGRMRHAMVYDRARQRVVLFGGYLPSLAYAGDMWEYDGTAWSLVSLAPSPTGRLDHAMVYDDARAVTVLFGGAGVSGRLGDTWEYDGAAWVPVSPPAAPRPRTDHAMAYDADRGVTVLFGGRSDAGYERDTWEYDGTTWSEIATPVSPPERARHAMSYLAIRGRMVLFGGGNPGYLQDTYEYDGATGTWSAVATSAAPSKRVGAPVVYEAARQRLFLFAGQGAGWYERPRDIWEYRYDSLAPAERCDDGSDNDGDGRIDCADGDCSGRSCGSPGSASRCAAGVCACPSGQASESACTDGTDDDCDALVDCADPDCGGDPSCGASETSCVDGHDNDGNGFVDCQDDDCFASPACAGGSCADYTPLQCSAVAAGDNALGSAARSSYPCAGSPSSGPEAYYRFTARRSGTHTAYLLFESSALDLIVVGAAADGTCDPSAQCLAADQTPDGNNLLEVSFPATVGQTYYLIVDGPGGNTSRHLAGVVCP